MKDRQFFILVILLIINMVFTTLMWYGSLVSGGKVGYTKASANACEQQKLLYKEQKAYYMKDGQISSQESRVLDGILADVESACNLNLNFQIEVPALQ